MNKEFKLPDVGEGLTEADIVTWRVAPGDVVTINQVIVEIETAKSLVELPSPFAGTVTKLLVDEGTTVDVGIPIIAIDDGTVSPRGDDPPSTPRQRVAPPPFHPPSRGNPHNPPASGFCGCRRDNPRESLGGHGAARAAAGACWVRGAAGGDVPAAAQGPEYPAGVLPGKPVHHGCSVSPNRACCARPCGPWPQSTGEAARPAAGPRPWGGPDRPYGNWPAGNSHAGRCAAGGNGRRGPFG